MSDTAVVTTSLRLRKLWRDGGAGLPSDGRPKLAGRRLNATDGAGRGIVRCTNAKRSALAAPRRVCRLPGRHPGRPPRSGLAIGNDSARNRSVDELGGAERLNADQFQSDSTR
jgi:hypothetical protein